MTARERLPAWRIRNERGHSLRDVAENAGIAFGYLAALERGEHGPSLAVARKLAAFYGVGIDDLFPEEEAL